MDVGLNETNKTEGALPTSTASFTVLSRFKVICVSLAPAVAKLHALTPGSVEHPACNVCPTWAGLAG